MALTRTRGILRLASIGDSWVTFASEVDDPDEQPRHTLRIRRDLYDDMDDAEVITVTVEPGDRLN